MILGSKRQMDKLYDLYDCLLDGSFPYVKTAMLIGILIANRWTADKSDGYMETRHRTVPHYDLFHSNVRRPPCINHHYLADLFICLLIVLWAPHVTVLTYSRFLSVFVFLFTVRFACIHSTIGYVSMRKAKNYDMGAGSNKNFTDMVISGHTITAVLIWLNILDTLHPDIPEIGFIDHVLPSIYPSEIYNIVSDVLLHWYTIVAFLATIASVLSNLFVGDHYTSDLIIATTLVYLAHYSMIF